METKAKDFYSTIEEFGGYITKGIQVITLNPKKHPNIFEYLNTNMDDILDEYREVWREHKAKVDQEPDQIKKMIRDALFPMGSKKLPVRELSEAEWNKVAKDIGLKSHKTRGEWVYMEEFEISIGGTNARLVTIKKAKND